jgi:hypothetical protein
VLAQIDDPIGPRNNWWLSSLRNQVDLVIAAWGIHGSLLSRDDYVIESFHKLHCLGVTKDGHPRHPLYLPADARPQRYRS